MSLYDGPLLSLLMFAAALVCLACGDPVHDDAIAKLGPEDPNVPRGPLHRPGQPCVTCHDAAGPAEEFSVAGTVYRFQQEASPLANARVHLVDGAGAIYDVGTNCAGNFFVRPGDFTPQYPLKVSVNYGPYEADMTTRIGREGSCGACHADPASQTTVGHVYWVPDTGTLTDNGDSVPPAGCP